jgi:hypothetical protein
MRRYFTLALAVMLAGCATATPPAQVTRFHQIASSGGLETNSYVQAEAPAGQAGPEWESYALAVRHRVETQVGLVRTFEGGGTPPGYRVRVGFERLSAAQARRQGSGVSVGVGGSTGSYGSGVGVGVGVDLTRLLGGGGPDTVLRLSVRIDRATDGVSLWEGRAETAVRSGTPAAQPSIAATRLTDALFASFPGTSGQTITVP